MNTETAQRFFKTPELSHRIELILHLLEYSNHLIIVKGNKGSGKSFLCTELVVHEESNLILKKLVLRTWSTNQDIIDSILDIQTANDPETQQLTIEDVQKWLLRCNGKQKIPALLIDSVDLLSDELFQFLLNMSQPLNNVPLLHLCLFCEPSFLERLSELGLEEADNRSIHIIEMPTFSDKQTAQFINHYYSDAISTEDGLFDEKTLRQIQRISYGLPGKILMLAEQYKTDPVSQTVDKEHNVAANKKGPLAKKRLIVVVMIALILLSVSIIPLLYETEPGTNKQTIRLDLPSPIVNKESTTLQVMPMPEPELARIEELSMPVIPELAQHVIDKQEEETKLLSEVGEQSATDKTSDAEQDMTVAATTMETEPTSGKELDENIQISVIEAEAESVLDNAETVDASPVKNVQAEKLPERNETEPSLTWLHAQQDDHYVLQLIGANKIKAIHFYLKHFPSNRDNIHAFTTLNKGKTWHILTYGIFNNRNAAKQEISGLPEQAKQMSPWPRSVKSLKELVFNQAD